MSAEEPDALGIIDGASVSQSDPIGQQTVSIYIPKITASCSGTILNQNWILTAAHCITPDLNPTEIRFGPDARNPVAVRKILGVVRHPSWFGSSTGGIVPNDIGLVHFEGGLPPGYTNVKLVPPTYTYATTRLAMTAAGYGRSRLGDPGSTETLLKSTVTTNLTFNLGEHTYKRLFAYNPAGLVSNGDSGGPDFIDAAAGLGAAEYVQVGIHSGSEQTAPYSTTSTDLRGFIPWIQSLGIELDLNGFTAQRDRCKSAIPAAITAIFHAESTPALESEWGRFCNADGAHAAEAGSAKYDAVAQMTAHVHTQEGCTLAINNAYARYLHGIPSANDLAAWRGPWDPERRNFSYCAAYNVGDNIKGFSMTASFTNDGSGYGQWTGGCPTAITNAFWKYLKRAPSETELSDWASANCDAGHLAMRWEGFDPGNNVKGWSLIPRYLNRMYWNPAGDSHAATAHYEFAPVTGSGVYRNLERLVVNEAGTQILGRRRDNGFLHIITYSPAGWGGGDFTAYSIDKVVQARNATINNYVIRTADGSVIALQYNGSTFGEYRLPDIEGQGTTNSGILDVATNADGTVVLGASPNGIRAWTFESAKGWVAWQFSNVATSHVKMPKDNGGLVFALLKSPSAYNGKLWSFYLNCAVSPCKWTELGDPTNLSANVKHSFQFRDFDVSDDGRWIHGTMFQGQTQAGTWSYYFDKGWLEAQASATPLLNIKTRGDGTGFYGSRRDDGLTWNSTWWGNARWLNGNTFGQSFEGALTPNAAFLYYSSPVASPNVLTGN